MPVVLLIIFGTIFTGKISGTSVNYREYFTTGTIAVGIATTTFVNLGISMARALVAALAPAQLQSGSLDDALGRLAERTGAEFGLPATFEVSGQARPLPAAAEVVLLRVCQEALANARQHAQADQAWVRLAYDETAVRLEVGDDGAGFDPDRVNGGFGLRGMRARVGEGGGTLVVRSAPGAGTSVRVEVPTLARYRRSGSCWWTTIRWCGRG